MDGEVILCPALLKTRLLNEILGTKFEAAEEEGADGGDFLSYGSIDVDTLQGWHPARKTTVVDVHGRLGRVFAQVETARDFERAHCCFGERGAEVQEMHRKDAVVQKIHKLLSTFGHWAWGGT